MNDKICKHYEQQANWSMMKWHNEDMWSNRLEQQVQDRWIRFCNKKHKHKTDQSSSL